MLGSKINADHIRSHRDEYEIIWQVTWYDPDTNSEFKVYRHDVGILHIPSPNGNLSGLQTDLLFEHAELVASTYAQELGLSMPEPDYDV